MEDFSRSVRQLAIPVLAVVLASVVTLLFWPLGQTAPFVPFIAAVIVGAWQGGLRGGLVSTGLSTLVLIGVHAWQASAGPAEATPDFALRLVLFAFMGVAAGYLAMQCQRAVGAHDRLLHTLAGAGEAWIFADTEGRVTFLNPLAQAWTGWSLLHARHRPLEQLFVLVHDETRAPIGLAATEVLKRRAPLELPADAVLLSAGGSAIPVAGCMRPIQNAEDQVVELMLSFRDVSASRQAARAQAQRELQLLQAAETERAHLQAALVSAEQTHASAVVTLRQQHTDRETSLQSTIAAMGAQLESKKEESVAATARERATTEGLRQELRARQVQLETADEALKDSQRQREIEVREARSTKEALERQLQEAGARHAALVQAKQAECDRTAEEGLRALTELETLRKSLADAKHQAAATLSETRRQFEREITTLEAKRHDEVTRVEGDLATARLDAERHSQRLAELGSEREHEARVHRETLDSLRRELAEETAHRQAAAERGALLADVIEACPQGMLVFDAQRRITCWNAALSKLTGKSAADLIGQPLPETFPDLEHGQAVQQITWLHERLGGDGVIGSNSRQGQLELASAKLPDGGGMAIVWERVIARPMPRPTARELNRDELEWLAYN